LSSSLVKRASCHAFAQASVLDEEANTRVFVALDALHEAWRDRLQVPKRAVQAFVYVDGVIGEMSPRYEHVDLWGLDIGISERVEKCLDPAPIIQEEYDRALARLDPRSPSWRIHHAWGDEDGLLMALHEGKGLDARAITDLFDAVTELGTAFRDEEEWGVPQTLDSFSVI
jgi:hypothetical protein